MNILVKQITGIFFIFFFLVVTSHVAYALPPKPVKPGAGGQPSIAQPNQPDMVFPPQPQLPPCVECDEFFNEPTPTPKAHVDPSPEPSEEDGGGPDDNNDDNDEDEGEDNGIGGEEVMGLSDTSSDKLITITTVLGILCLGVSVKLLLKRSSV